MSETADRLVKGTETRSLTIVIVNWNTGGELRECLQSIEGARQATFRLDEVVIVDNASCDTSLEGVAGSPLPTRIIRNVENRGFGFACNQGAAGAQSDYLLFLNPDTRLERWSLTAPLEFMSRPENRSIGTCGIQLRDKAGHVSRSCARFPTFDNLLAMTVGLTSVLPNVFPGLEMKDWDHGNSQDVDHVIGAFYLIRRQVFERVGGFDERFFVYFEDLDLSMRVAHAGCRTHYLASVAAVHEGGGASKQIKATRLFYVCRSRVQLAWKHLPRMQAVIIAAVVIVIEPIIRLVGGIARRKPEDIRNVLEGTGKLWRDFLLGPRAFVQGRAST